MIKAIIFDFGGVFSIIDDFQEFWQKNGVKLGVDPEEAIEIFSPLWEKACVGQIDSNIILEKLGTFTKTDPKKLKGQLIELSGFRDELYEYVKKNLKGKYKLAILSDHVEAWLELVLEEKKFREVFDVIVTSYNTGFVKPDIRIFEKVLKDLDVKAEECIFVEDMQENLVVAKNLGMNIIEFKNYNQFVKDFDNF
jgi:epoxide hydrolase-like predicted phosphatase